MLLDCVRVLSSLPLKDSKIQSNNIPHINCLSCFTDTYRLNISIACSPFLFFNILKAQTRFLSINI